MAYNMKNVPANSGRILGEDGEVYNLVDLLKNVGGGNMDPNDFYTKTEADEIFQPKGDYATVTQVSTKADKSYVDAELAKKANASSLTNKADKSVVDDLIARVEALEGAAGGA